MNVSKSTNKGIIINIYSLRHAVWSVGKGYPHHGGTHQGCDFNDKGVGCMRRLSGRASSVFRDTPTVLGGTKHSPCVPHFGFLLLLCPLVSPEALK